MSVSVASQAYSLAGALLLGTLVGLFYDLLRALRRRMAGVIFGAVLDLLFWLAVTATLFLWSLAAGNGVVQLSVCAALFLGGVFYFRHLSPLLYPLVDALVGCLARFIGLLLAPFRLIGALVSKIGLFFAKILKKHFSFSSE
jgi:hypothetical protein